ncbi:putative ribonuclease R [Leptospira interrogans serovar Grippotyphosa str. UI 12769]|uniref:exoribonuclease II n=1 Tax=Leptospira interrogans str. UI 12621 TaxID=1049937 RepID=A0A0F6H8W7_LEPIR|nr:VacB/RNase II family 3'-5' exoribonuclease [Leptospira interrogans]EKO24700.1 putative ribonuclease R [Leptospira interrogans str. UI 12621]EMN72327.1 putative ribonuclease R [Leptospira interrogans serovar Bataviae str. UI 08561]EMN80155.1 putative ribonuclease R [Leptospira interrogans serovar Grippotyphosa str. UI 12764]EMN83867.1 putative ribonuclease R [Leptospira interrogans serovar Grippotyphosa str. UI 12769]
MNIKKKQTTENKSVKSNRKKKTFDKSNKTKKERTDGFRENEIGKKILKYIQSRAGSVIQFKDLNAKILREENQNSYGKKREKWEFQEKEREILETLKILETEGLIELEKKNIIINSNQKLQGTISISKKGDGFVKLSSGVEIFVPNQYTQSAIQGDLVEVRPYGVGKKRRLEGEVTEILRRGRDLYRMIVTEKEPKFIFGKLLDIDGEEKEGYLLRKTILTDLQEEIQSGDVLIVKLKEETEHEKNLYEVQFLRFESDTKEDLDLMRMLMKYNYNILYPENIILDLPEEVNESTVDDWNERVDLRNLKCITIDGEYSKDFDDAISFVEEKNRIRFYVHIADVSYYVRPGNDLDEEAYNRATSVYLGSRVVPMLPPELSESLCSLIAGKNRLAFTVEMEADWKGKITHAKYYKSIINVKERYTYNKAESEILSGDSDNWIFRMNEFAKILRTKRIEDGRVDLNLKENKVVTDSEHNVIEIAIQDRLQSHILIEEFMLSANIKVAEYIRKKKHPTLYRVHEAMNEEKIESLNAFLQLNATKILLKDSSYESIRSVLKELEAKPAERLFNMFLLRTFMQAYYSGEHLGHWGLGFEDYCHFTSPIRRYPDLVCHRVLQNILLGKKPIYTPEEIVTFGLHCSHQERKASDAERDYYKLKACRYLEKTGIKEFSATITGCRPHLIFVDLENPAVDACLFSSEFTDEGEIRLETDFSFYSKKYSKIYTLGDKIEVELDRIDYEEIKIFVKMKKFQKKV